jgi:conjugative transfer region protein, TIGR03750 family
MNDTIERLADGTLVFLPERLNRDPAVLRGLTNDEMWVALGVGALVGLILGVPLAIATASIAVAPTSMIAGMAAVLFAGGSLLRRAKRARPEIWLYRKLEWVLASRWHVGRGSLILHSGGWTVRRSRRLRPAQSRWQS